MQLADLLDNIPTIHNYSEDSGRSPRLDNTMLRFLDRTVRPGMRTVETGAGISTILFAIKGAQHTCIVPDPRQIARIQDYCASAGVPLDTTTFVAEPSEVGLPQLRGQTFDLALIDGGHGFPLPFVDWYYMAELLDIGGLVVIDDLHIWTCDTLVQFLHADPAWACVVENSRAAVFRKLRADYKREWDRQPFVLRRSRFTSRLAKLGYVARLVRQGQIGLLVAAVRERLKKRVS
ncbi:MAG TPA: class I SAM-dependent methyltransferase [Roseiflexaceae bacterium]|nr:class I SAM-dependent methyltransferase [Roseiflexaceae bacterium]